MTALGFLKEEVVTIKRGLRDCFAQSKISTLIPSFGFLQNQGRVGLRLISFSLKDILVPAKQKILTAHSKMTSQEFNHAE
jgi:hypothetical protein